MKQRKMDFKGAYDMKQRGLFSKSIALLISMIFMVQNFGAVPVFAAGIDFYYILDYGEDEVISPTHPIIIPDSDIDPYDGAGTHYNFNSNAKDITVTTGNVIPQWGPEPYRVIGYTFDGWYTEPDGGGTKVEKNTVITDEMLDTHNKITLYGNWKEYNSPDITTDSLTISAKNSKLERLSNVTIRDELGNEGFKSDTTEYYAEVYGNTQYLTLDFEQYEPDAVTSVTFNGSSVAFDDTKKQILTATGYTYDTDGITLISNTYNTGVKLATVEDSIELDMTSAEQEYNIIKITVKLPESSPVSERTYTIKIKRLNMQLLPNYGNMPYGRIMNDYTLSDDKKADAKTSFDSTYQYRGGKFVPDAWNPFGVDGIEVVKGSTPVGKQYINYDKDDTAIVVYSGDSFTDPGVTLYDENGTPVTISDTKKITRTINYETSSTLKFEDWGNATQKQDISYLTGNDSDLTVDILEQEPVKPGIYNIIYSYTSDYSTVTAERKMIVLPKAGDVNMDNYINALDLFAYDKSITEDSITNCLYKYRALDVNNDGTADNADREYLKNRGTIKELYPSYSVEKTITQTPYTVPAAPDSAKAQLYMDFLGTDSTSLDAAADASQEIKKSDVIWTGYRFDNTARLDSGNLKLITLAVNYDSRYIKPDADNLADYIAKINTYNPQLSVFNIEGVSDVAGGYSVDGSSAKQTWQDIASVRTLTLEMYLKDGESFSLSDGYFIKLPFLVSVIPPSDGRCVISTQLGANTLNMAAGDSGYGIMWDTSDSLNSVTENLMSRLEYMGDYVPVFEPEAEAVLLKTAKYGDTINISKSSFNKGTLDGTLPQGISYTKSLNTIIGTAQEVGTFDFYINGVKYRIVIEKAELKVTAEDKTKTYGEGNPALTYIYDNTCLKNGDTWDLAVQTNPVISCTAGQKSAYLSETPITLSGGASTNYYFTFVDGTLTVDKQREINITDISKIPVCTSQMAKTETFPYTIPATAVSDAGEFTASEIIEGDKIKISYGVTYDDNTVGPKTVTISAPVIVTGETGYESGANYTVKSCITSSNGKVEDKTVTNIAIDSMCTLAYTYGTPLDLQTGAIKITYDSGEVVTKTFEEAKSLGVRIRYGKTNTEAKNGDKITVDYSGTNLIVDYPSDSSIRSLYTGKLDIAQKELHIKADNKERYYGDENSTCHDNGGTSTGFTYTFNTGDFVYGENQNTFTGFVPPTFSCDADASTEVDNTKGYGESDIVLTGGSSDNYKIICEKGTLKINKRPLGITKITAGVPALTAENYTGKTAPYKVIASAIAGAVESGEAVSMTVDNLYNNDSVKITYNAQYANSTPADSVNVTVADAAMDDSYGKSYNYTVRNAVQTAEGGRVYVKNIKALEIIDEPTRYYVYGTPLDLNTGKIKITYDSGDVENVTFEAAKSHPIKLTYTGTTDEVLNNTHLTVADTGKTITVTPDTIYDVEAVTSGAITVTPHELNVTANDIYTTYGDVIPAYTYTYKSGDLQYGETEDTALNKKPSIVCKEDNGVTDVNQKTLSGVYTMKISGAEADNYNIIYKNGNLTIRQKPLIVAVINNIPNLSSQNAFDRNLSFNESNVVDNSSSELTFAANYGPLWQDKVRINYTVTYPDASAVGATDVNIENAVLDKTYGDARNYYLQKIVSPQTGFVEKAIITKIEITADPTKNTDGTVREYSYGDTLDFSEGKFRITFDSGRVDENVAFDKLGDYGITAKYTGTSDIVEDGKFATINYHNNKTITLTPPSDATAAAETTGSIKVNKRKMHVIVNDSVSTYGNKPSYTLNYTEADLADGETLLTAFGSPFIAPVLSCDIDGAAADVTTAAGTYANAIKASGGSCNNYEFVCDDTGTLTVNKRALTISSINSGIPTLTAEEAYKHNYTLPIELDGTADNSNLTMDCVNNDSISITYKAVYNSLTQSENEPIGIKDVKFADSCSSKDNYDIVNPPTDAVGKVMTRLISKITVNSDPSDMEYTYGEWFKLAGGSVDIEYNSGYIESNITFDKLADFGIDIYFVSEDEQGNEIIGAKVKNNTLLTVPVHNGARIKLVVANPTEAIENIAPAYSGTITVHKKKMRVEAEDETMVYGGSAPEYRFNYNKSDLVNGDSLTSSRFTDNLIEPNLLCTSDGSNIDSTTPAGEYEIVPSGGECSNYEFVAVNGTLTIEKKEIEIISVDTGVPILTSEIIYNQGGKAPVTISSVVALYTASQKDVTVTGVINGDELGFTYSAVYNSILAGDSVTVDVKDFAFDTTHERNNCYKIIDAPETATGGTVLQEQITKVTITSDPVLRNDNNQPIQYTYGDRLNLNRGAVTVEYDSGRIQKDLKFSEIESKTDGLVKLIYTDGSNETTDSAADGDILYTSYHHGKSIKLKVTSRVNVSEPQTAPIIVNKAEITVTAKDKEKYYGDKNPQLEFEYSGFVNGDNENSDNFKLELVPPDISCSAGIKSPIGVYDIELSGGSAANYKFKNIPAKLTVNKRPVDIIAITGGIPVLTSKIIYDEPKLVHKLDGSAINTAGQIAVGNLSEKDELRITYTVIYTDVEPAKNIIVSVSDILLDTEYGEGGNYELRSVPKTAYGGNILEKQISMLEITKQPKLTYTYGETLDLSQKGVRITYDSGLVVSGVAFDELDSYGIEITRTDPDGETVAAAHGDKLSVVKNNGAYLTLTPHTTLNNITPAVTGRITVNQKAVDVNVDDVMSVYGDDPTVKFGFSYDSSDFEYGETPESSDFKDNLTEPYFVCIEKDGSTPVGTVTDTGSYTITMKGGGSDNYRFVYHDGTLVITRRPVKISDITGGIPTLTSDIIFAAPGTAHKLDAKAVNSQLVLDNVVNNDNIRISYKAVYNSEVPTDNCTVGIEYVSVDDEYGKSYNYVIDTENSTKSVEGGSILDKEITSLEITEQPKLSYTYGDKLDLSGGKVKITYDSGYIEENITFDKLADHRITLSYTDGSNSFRTAADKDVLFVPEHSGKLIALTARSTHDVTVVKTDPITVSQKLLEYGECIVDSIVYDGASTATTGKIVFANPQNGDTVTARGTFNFDSFNAGENKTVYITDIVLDDKFTANYKLLSDSTTAAGTILKASPSVPTGDITSEISDISNTLTVTAPELSEQMLSGGARYEYSIDGGNTWQESNVFEKLAFGLDCGVCVRIAESDNYNASSATVPVNVKSYLSKITLIAKEDGTNLKAFFTNTEAVENEKAFKEFIGEVSVPYYRCYYDAEGKNLVKYPMEISGDMTIYASLKKPSSDGGVGGSSGNAVPKATPKPTASPSVKPTESPQPTDTPEPTDAPPSEKPEKTAAPQINTKPDGVPYITGYKNEVRPSALMTRAEVTKIISVISNKYDKNKEYPSKYYDVDKNSWYYSCIGYASSMNWVKGYLDGYFYPEKTITRAEFAAITARYLNIEPESGTVFTDTYEDVWSTGYITALFNKGILKGYLDGTYHPENDITRAEGITLINRIIKLVPDKSAIDNIECPFIDLDKSHWAYYEIMAASCEY